MYFYRLSALLASADPFNVSGGGGEAAAAAGDAAAGAAEGAAQSGGFLGGIGASGILMYAALIAVLYLVMIRPQRKREKQMREMQNALKVGDDVLTTSGMYGVIMGVGDDCFIIEFGLNKGVRVPVGKASIVGVKKPVITPPKESEKTEPAVEPRGIFGFLRGPSGAKAETKPDK